MIMCFIMERLVTGVKIGRAYWDGHISQKIDVIDQALSLKSLKVRLSSVFSVAQ